MSRHDYPQEFLALLKSVTAKRPKTVIDHILQHGQITTEELKSIYGYNHPPRAIRDVREQGIPIDMFRVTGSDGRNISAYKFGDPDNVRSAVLSGRTAFTTKLKNALIEKYGARCNIYLEVFPLRELQIDHRIPFEISGDSLAPSEDVNDYMLLCASANRAKSWSCEHCSNWLDRQTQSCQTCYWAFPDNYQHIAMRDIRRIDVIWSGKEIADYEKVKQQAHINKQEIPEFVKQVLLNQLSKR